MTRPSHSGDALKKASETSAEFSGHDGGLGARGVVDDVVTAAQDSLDKKGESGLITPPEGGFANIHVGLSWNNLIVEQSSSFMGLIKKMAKIGVDLDLGCFFEMQDGTRGILQPFGNLLGNLNALPYIQHCGDERTGDAEGDDEYLTISGQHWPQIKRILVYAYIYEGACDWSQIKPQISINLHNGQDVMHIHPALKTTDMTVCALATMKNIKNGIQIVTHGEYFASQAAMDRAFGFGLQWEDGAK